MSGLITFGATENGTNLSVSIIIDAKHGMTGPKINGISQAVREIVSNAPASVNFGVYVFNKKVKKVIADKKQNINLNTLVREINSNCGSDASFYDGWGQAMNEIPYIAGDSDYYHLLVFSYGSDSSSIIYNLDSVINLLNEKLIRNTKLHFTFIQAGTNFLILNALQQKCMVKDRCVLIKVEDSAVGIQMGFAHVKTTLQSKLQSLSLGQAPPIVIYQPVTVPTVYIKPEPRSTTIGLGNGSYTVRNRPRIVRGQQIQQPSQTSTSNSFKIWVGNLPMVNKTQIQDFLQQWGPCRIETLNGTPTQWAVVAYDTLKAVEYAVKYGNGANFQGQTININKI